jgi:hypothetical protein
MVMASANGHHEMFEVDVDVRGTEIDDKSATASNFSLWPVGGAATAHAGNLITFLRTEVEVASTLKTMAETTKDPKRRAKLPGAIRHFVERITDS